MNSAYKQFGRTLEFEVMDRNKTSDSIIGYGIVDLDPYVGFKSMHEQLPSKLTKLDFRSFINFDNKPAGFINVQGEFIAEETETFHIRFETAEFKRKTRSFGDMNCSVRVTAGEEVL